MGGREDNSLKVVPAESIQPCLLLRSLMGCSPQAPLSMGFSRQEYWSGLPFPSPGRGEKGLPQIQHSWKGWWEQAAKKPVLCLRTWSCILNMGGRGFCEGLEQEGELCRQQRGSLIRTDPKT